VAGRIANDRAHRVCSTVGSENQCDGSCAVSRSRISGFITLFALAIAVPTSGLRAQESSDSVVARATADGATAAQIRRVGLYPVTAFLGGAAAGFFSPFAFGGKPIGMVALAGVSSVVLSSEAAAKDSGVLPDSIRVRISNENVRYQDAFARSYEAELNAVRQKRVILFSVLGIAAGLGALVQIAGSGT
jgi:hypothetical protein